MKSLNYDLAKKIGLKTLAYRVYAFVILSIMAIIWFEEKSLTSVLSFSLIFFLIEFFQYASFEYLWEYSEDN